MTVDALLLGPSGHGGEEVYVQTVGANPPPGVRYRVAGGFHDGAPGARCNVVAEVLLNRLVHPRAIPDMGFRVLRLRERADLVHVHAHPVRLTNLRGAPLVMSEGSSSAVYLGDYLGWSEVELHRGFTRSRRIYRVLGIRDRLLAQDRAARVYVFSEWARRVNIRWGADTDKLDVVYPGFPVPSEVTRGGEETYRFLFVGTDFERKGGFELIEAFKQVVAADSSVRLTIVAPHPARRHPDRRQRSWVDPVRRRRALAVLETLERRGQVERFGPMDRRRLFAAHFPRADAFVMPAHAEGFGFTNVEAMSFGLPVISSTVGPIPEVVAHQKTGILVAPGDSDGLAAAMHALGAHRDVSRRMGEAGRAEFASRFTIDRFREALGAVYRRALAQ